MAIAQQAHAWMCGQLARAWGNERFGAVEPAEEVCLAAEQHEGGMALWDLEPELDPDTGAARTVRAMDLDVHLPLRFESSRRLTSQSRYAALLATLHHVSFYDRPPAHGKLKRAGRQIAGYLDRCADLERSLRATVDAGEAEIERNWRIVRAIDGLSHDLLLERVPCTRENVPVAGGALVPLAIEKRDGRYAVDPWPFAADRVVARCEGRLLAGGFTEEEAMRAALREAPWVDLAYELTPG